MKPVRRWPLFLIGAPAAVSVWSGWVGLGELCGFGVIHPLPGILPGFALNTAITLPVGVEAYGAYALGAWLAPAAPETARKFARRSAIGSLALGMLGQVIFHLLSAANASRAPAPVVVLVSCIPVVTLGFGAALAHLLRVAESGAETAGEPAPVLAAESGPVAPEEPPDMALGALPSLLPEPVPADARSAAEASLRATLAAGNPLSANALQERFSITRKTAQDLRRAVLAESNGGPG